MSYVRSSPFGSRRRATCDHASIRNIAPIILSADALSTCEDALRLSVAGTLWRRVSAAMSAFVDELPRPGRPPGRICDDSVGGPYRHPLASHGLAALEQS